MRTTHDCQRIILPLIATFLAMTMGSGAALAQQASITLTNSDAQYCFTHDNLWTIQKGITGNTVADGQGTVTWTVTAIKDTSNPATFSVHGGLTVTNTGTAPATIGNIVVNLQKPRPGMNDGACRNVPWVSVAADIADATNGDDATMAYIVAGGSQENEGCNGARGAGNYDVQGAKGTFDETAGSGSLEFKDASSNTLFSLVPQPIIPVNGSVTLLYDAEFATSVLPPAGTPLRVEVLVSFGNAGARGGSGATANNIDINGNTIIDADEAKVRTVPARTTMAALPAAPQETNNSVNLTDVVSTTGTVTTSNLVSNVPATTSASGSWTVSVDVSSGADGGKVCNTVDLNGQAVGGTLNVIIGYDTTDPLNPKPIYATYECVAAADDEANSCVDIGPPSGFEPGEFCSFSQGGFGGRGAPFQRLNANFMAIYPNGVEVGISGSGGFSMTFTSATAVQAYLPAGGTAGALIGDLIDPTSSSSGVFGGQTLALELNIALSDAAVNPEGLGDLYYCDAASSLDGLTIREILAVAETALGGGPLPSGYDYSTIASLIEHLDTAFDGKDVANPDCGIPSAWAEQNLSKTPCL